MVLGDITGESGIFIDGDWIESKDQNANGDVRLIQLADIGEGVFKNRSNRHITSEKAVELNCTFVKKGDILIARLGEPLCKACVFPLDGKYITAVDVAIFRTDRQDIFRKYLVYLINSPWFKGQVKLYESGTTRKRISRKNLNRIEIPIPSFDEQQRIVSRIEELFSSLDNALETLQKTKEQLAVYRQAVLKEAFDSAGEDCRMLPIAEILTKSRKGMSTGPFGTMIKKSDHRTSGVPMLGIENIGRGKFVDGNKIFVSKEKAEELRTFSLMAGDIIISRSGTVGEICAVPERAEGALLSTNLMRISLDNDIIRSDYFIALFQSKGIVMDQIKELCKGSTRDFLNQTILKQIVFPVPSIEKQSEIVSILEARMSVCDSIEQTVNAAFAQAEAMRQSILKEAFEGRL